MNNTRAAICNILMHKDGFQKRTLDLLTDANLVKLAADYGVVAKCS